MVVDKDKCNPQGCGGYLCMRVSPSNRAGKEAIVKDKDGKVKVNEDVITDADKIAANKCPFDALEMVNLPAELEKDPVHRYLPNGFSLYSVPVPISDKVVGILGRNGIGKSTALQIVSGDLEPNFGSEDNEGFEELLDYYKGTEAQNYFTKLLNDDIVVAVKPQHVEQIPKVFEGTVESLLNSVNQRNALDEVTDAMSLRHIMDRDVKNISGGELQRVAIAATILKDADLYLFDEPTSYLDVKQRVSVSQYIKTLVSENTSVIVIEHDLIILDYLTDLIHIMFGESGAYGVSSLAKTTKAGVNMYLDGYIPEENMRFRSKSISFERRSATRSSDPKELVAWDGFSVSLGTFTLKANEGSIQKKDVVGVLGENGTGKSTFMKALTGEIESDTDIENELDIAYKPQYIEKVETPVRLWLGSDATKYKASVWKPLDIEPLLDKPVNTLSGGEMQRAAIAKCLCQDADIYLLDEPSAYLDAEQRLKASTVIRNYMSEYSKSAVVIDHDLLFIDYISTKLMVFEGEPGREGHAIGPVTMRQGMNRFLEELEITFRRDTQNNRPRINKEGSQKDKQQKAKGDYYYDG